MICVAKDRASLRKRIQRFLKRACLRDRKLAVLLDVLTLREGYLFGGVLRDIALFGIDRFSSDLDIVYVSHGRRIEHSVWDLLVETNRFGGLRLRTDRWYVDVWEAENTWAFRQGLRSYESVRSLLDTTITNWDSVLYDLKRHSLICREEYFDELGRRYLDLVLKESPNVLGMYVRLLRACASKDVDMLSESAASVVLEGLKKHSYSEVNDYERAHFQGAEIGYEMYEYLREQAEAAGDVVGDFKVGEVQRALPLT